MGEEIVKTETYVNLMVRIEEIEFNLDAMGCEMEFVLQAIVDGVPNKYLALSNIRNIVNELESARSYFQNLRDQLPDAFKK